MKIKFWYLLTFLLLFQCGRVPDTHYYTIHYQIPLTTDSPERVAGELVVAKITAEDVYQGDRLVYQHNPFEYKYYHYRRWIQPPPDLLEKWLVRHLRARILFSRVSSYSNRIRMEKNYELLVHISDFKEVDNGSQWLAEARFEYHLLAQNKIVAEGVVAKTVSAQERTPLAVVEAMSQAVKLSFDELAEKITTVLTEK